MSDNSIVILFAKIPIGGRVKTRLTQDLDGDLVLRLYESMVLDTIDTLREGGFPFRICISPPSSVAEARVWLGSDYDFMPQTGDDLGERMEQAFNRAFSGGFDTAVLIGSDIPGLSSGILREAFASLSKNNAVIGPENDGGYYLIGFNRRGFYPDIFHSMPWSTPAVFRETMARLSAASHLVHVLPERIDADTKQDLITLLRSEDAEAGSRVLSLLMRHERSFMG